MTTSTSRSGMQLHRLRLFMMLLLCRRWYHGRDMCEALTGFTDLLQELRETA
jgi:hypothetical protein